MASMLPYAVAATMGPQQPQQAPQQLPTGFDPNDPMAAQIAAFQAKLAQPLQRMYSPEQIQQRQADNERQYQLGILGQLSGDQDAGTIGGQVLKQALAARAPKITERGTADPITGEFNYDPDYLRTKDEATLTGLQTRQSQMLQQRQLAKDAQAAKADADRQRAQDRMDQIRMHDQDTNDTRRMVAGLTGQLGGGQMSGLVDALGTNSIDPAVAFARMAPAARADLITQVRAKYPDYDPTTYGAKAKGAVAFGSGPLGNQDRMFAVANNHIDQLSALAQAIHNGNTPAINQIANFYGVQTGQTPVAVFNAVRQLVGPEITGAIVAGGGSAHERDQAAATFNPNSTPEQFAATIGSVRALMQAKHDALQVQRSALGLSDKTKPAYAVHGAPAAPAGQPPAGVDATTWAHMTAQERALWQN